MEIELLSQRSNLKRRDFLHFLGISGLSLTTSNELLAAMPEKNPSQLTSLPPTILDQVTTLEGIKSNILIRWGDKINSKEKFGFNNDFIAFHSLSENRALLWVNHESVNSLFINGPERTKENIDLERLEVGGSIIEIKKSKSGWEFVKESPLNRRLDATTTIPFAWPEKIMDSNMAIGTMAGCAGGYTPWGTFLSCEENYDMFWGERDRKGHTKTQAWMKWNDIYPLPPEHYGWVVEIEPKTGKAKKLVSLGRMAHECAAVTRAKNGKIVAYTGDDTINEHFYKFISDSDDSLESGKMYVANLEKGEWISLHLADQPLLQKHFKTQTEVQIWMREAAKIVGATPLDRPEDIEFDPLTGNVLVTLTNNKVNKNFHGSILKISENNNDPGSMKFSHDTFLSGGKETGFACPDNMVFDPIGNLWFTTDIAGDAMNKGPYEGFGNNSLFVFLRSGQHKGRLIRVASAPHDAEFTGPCFSPDYKTLFLSVQHPGEESSSIKELTSHWPNSGTGLPQPSVITLQGPLLNKIISGQL
jgi:secreted PhoX family phosphatase